MRKKNHTLLALTTLSSLAISSVSYAKPLEEIPSGSNIVAFINGAHLQATLIALKDICLSLNRELLDKEKKTCGEKDLLDLAAKMKIITIAEDENTYNVDFFVPRKHSDLIKRIKSNHVEYGMSKEFKITYIYKGHK